MQLGQLIKQQSEFQTGRPALQGAVILKLDNRKCNYSELSFTERFLHE